MLTVLVRHARPGFIPVRFLFDFRAQAPQAAEWVVINQLVAGSKQSPPWRLLTPQRSEGAPKG